MDIDRRQAGAVIRDFDVLHARPLDVFRRVPEARNATHIGVETFLALRLQKSLANVVVGAGAVQILRAAGGVALGDALAPAVFDRARLARPFAEPGIVVADTVPQAQADAVDLADLGAAPRGHVEPDQQAVRPAVIFGKIGERQLFELGIHANELRLRTCQAIKASRPPRAQYRLDRDARPGRGALTERRVGRMHLAGDLVLASELVEHVGRLLARGFDEILGKS